MFFKKPGKYSWIAVFLGNPGPKYAMTRHNAGFITAEAYAKLHGAKIDRLKFHALTGEAEVGGEKVLLMKPQTYMNESGTAVREAMSFYKVPLDRVLVVSDDVSLDLGRIRIRRSGSAGGHNGLKDIIAKCNKVGKPVIVAKEEECSPEMRAFFTVVKSQWPNEKSKKGGWNLA